LQSKKDNRNENSESEDYRTERQRQPELYMFQWQRLLKQAQQNGSITIEEYDCWYRH